MMSAAPGIPIMSSAATNGDSPSFVLSHGRIATIRNTDST